MFYTQLLVFFVTLHSSMGHIVLTTTVHRMSRAVSNKRANMMFCIHAVLGCPVDVVHEPGGKRFDQVGFLYRGFNHGRTAL